MYAHLYSNCVKYIVICKMYIQQREIRRLQNEVKSLERGKGELSGKLENQKEMTKSKMAEIEVLKEWDKVSVAHAWLSVYLHVELYAFYACDCVYCYICVYTGERCGVTKEQGRNCFPEIRVRECKHMLQQ